MRRRFHKFICLLVIAAMLTTSLIPVSTILAAGSAYDGSAAEWALPEVQKAEANGLTYPDILKTFDKTITREEFCILVVKLYEKLTNETAAPGNNPFTDTDNPEIVKAYNLGVVKGTATDRFSPSNNVTRQEMAAFLVRTLKIVYPKLSAEDTNLTGFSDADRLAQWARPAMVFCINNGIFKGVGANLLNPLGNTDRQQAIALIQRVFANFQNWSGPSSTLPPTASSLPSIIEAGKIPRLSAVDGINKLDPRMDFAHPAFDTALTLYAATGEGKPSSFPTVGSIEERSGAGALVASNGPTKPAALATAGFIEKRLAGDSAIAATGSIYALLSSQILTPSIPATLPKTIPTVNPLPGKILTPKIPIKIPTVIPKPVLKYTKSPYAAFIDSGGDGKHYFYCTLQTSDAAKIVWQVAKYPFQGLADGWKTPSGLVSSGEILPGTKEFYIDFGKFNQMKSSNILLPSQFLFGSNEIKMERKTYYVRAVPVDSAGNCVGQPGTGLPVVFGKPQVHRAYQSQGIASAFELWIAKYPGASSTAEFPNNFHYDPNLIYGSTPGDGTRYFQLNNFDPGITRFVVQVATGEYGSTAADWENPNGLVYKKEYLPDKLLDYATGANAFYIDFEAFSPPVSALGEEAIKYYVRVIGLKPVATDEGGMVQPLFSNTRIYTYAKPAKTTIYDTKNIVVPNHAPQVILERYEPIQFQAENWMEYFEVYKQAQNATDLNFKIYNTTTDKYLYPFVYYSSFMFPALPDNIYGWENISAGDYLKLVNSVLPVGSELHFTKPEKADQAWYEELWDLVSSFFEQIFATVAKIVNYVSKLYASIKVSIIKYVVAAIPLIPPQWQGALQQALEVLADTALLACGLPPTLPNLDQLMDEGLSYALNVAAQEAGIPADQLTQAAKEKIKEEIKAGISSDKSSGRAPNPVDSPLLRTSSKVMYRPAYMDLKIKNNDSQKISPDGVMTIRVEETKWPYWKMYEPWPQKIPQLMPNEEVSVRVYLKEIPFKTYDGAFGQTEDGGFTEYINQDAINRYLGKNGITCNFTVTTTYNVPHYSNMIEAAKAEGVFKSDGKFIYNYYYSDQGNSISFEGIPANTRIGY